MARYIVLYHADVTATEQMQQSADDGAAEMQAWMEWAQRVGAALVDMGSPLGATTAETDEGSATVARSTAVGYSMLEAPDADAAAAMMAGHPHLRIGTIQLHQMLNIPGM